MSRHTAQRQMFFHPGHWWEEIRVINVKMSDEASGDCGLQVQGGHQQTDASV